MWREGEGKRVCSKCGTVRLAEVERCPECGTKRSRNAFYEPNPNRPPEVQEFWELPVDEREKVHLSLLIAADKGLTVQQWADLLFDEMLCPGFPYPEKWYDTFFAILYNSGIRAIDKRWYVDQPQQGVNPFTGQAWGRGRPRAAKAQRGINPATGQPWGHWAPPEERGSGKGDDSGCGACVGVGCVIIFIIIIISMCASLGGN